MVSTQTQPAAPDADDPTVVVADDKATALVGLAWSDTDNDETIALDDDRDRTTFWLWLYAGTAAAVVLILGVVLWFVLSDHHHPTEAVAVPASAAPDVVLPASPAVAAPAPVPSATPAPAAHAPAVTIEASPPVMREVPPPPVAAPVPPAPATTFDASRDQWLLNNLRSLGYTIVNPSLVIANAHEACRLLQQGESTDQMNQQMQARMGASTIDTLQLTSSAMLAYPDCY
jgi:hypothetical protein